MHKIAVFMFYGIYDTACLKNDNVILEKKKTTKKKTCHVNVIPENCVVIMWLNPLRVREYSWDNLDRKTLNFCAVFEVIYQTRERVFHPGYQNTEKYVEKTRRS